MAAGPRRTCRIDPDLRQKVLALHGQGQRPSQIGRATGLTRKQVAALLAAEGIKREPFVPASAVLPRIVELHEQGLTLEEIGEKVGYSRGAVGRALRGSRLK